MNNIKGIEKISERITGEAKSIADNEILLAKQEAEKIISAAEEKAKISAGNITEKAKENADAFIHGIKSSASMKERNTLLAVKNDGVNKAFDKAYELLCTLEKDVYVTLMADYMVNTVKSIACVNDVTINFCRKDSEYADEILNKASKAFDKINFLKGNTVIPEECGFVIVLGDTEINCTAKAILEQGKKSLEKSVLDILFDEK